MSNTLVVIAHEILCLIILWSVFCRSVQSSDRVRADVRTAFFLLGIVVTLPIPFGNWLPAFALCIIGVAHTERDGYSLAAGTLIGIASLAIVVLVVMATGALLMQIF